MSGVLSAIITNTIPIQLYNIQKPLDINAMSLFCRLEDNQTFIPSLSPKPMHTWQFSVLLLPSQPWLYSKPFEIL